MENCWVLGPIRPTYLYYCGGWSTIMIIYGLILYCCVPKSKRLSLQKTLLLLPLSKALETGLEALFLYQCPFYSVSSNSLEYINMARISLITIAYTIFLSVTFLVCQGWQTTFSSPSRPQVTHLTMIVGGSYLSYTAYFFSTDFQTIYVIGNCVMSAMYLALMYSFIQSALG